MAAGRRGGAESRGGCESPRLQRAAVVEESGGFVEGHGFSRAVKSGTMGGFSR